MREIAGRAFAVHKDEAKVGRGGKRKNVKTLIVRNKRTRKIYQ